MTPDFLIGSFNCASPTGRIVTASLWESGRWTCESPYVQHVLDFDYTPTDADRSPAAGEPLWGLLARAAAAFNAEPIIVAQPTPKPDGCPW